MPGRAPLRALLFLFLRTLLLLLGSARAAAAEPSPHLPAPEDVEVYSYNFHSLLRWSPVPAEPGPVLYTVHYKTGAFPVWNEMNCTRIPRPRCAFPPEIQKRRWMVFLRVRAELGRVPSGWVFTEPFVAERNTTLGPPSVDRVSASPDSLLLSVSPPFTPEPGDTFRYRVSYWENSTSTTRKSFHQEQEAHRTLLQIGNLKESTLYCFSLRVEFQGVFGDLLGQQSAPQCHRTALSELSRAGSITLLCLLVLLLLHLAGAAFLLLWKHRRKIKQWAQPPLDIPTHFQEFLRDPDTPGLEELDSPTEEEPQAVEVGEGTQAWSSSPG